MKRLFIGAVMPSAFLVVLLLSVTVEAQATTRRVPTDYPNIQGAINASINGDTVLVAPGTYTENIDFVGKAITVSSEGGAQVTIIDGGSADSVVTFASGEGRDSVLNGFTLQNGRSSIDSNGTGDGGGIRIQGASPTITRNIIKNNLACNGCGISILDGSPLIQLNTVTQNAISGCSGGLGAGISILRPSSAQILDNVISDNTQTRGISLNGAGTPTIKGNIIRGNSVGVEGFFTNAEGGGIWMINSSNPLIIQNLIIGNRADVGGGIYWLVSFGAPGPLVVNNTIADNDAPEGSGIFAAGYGLQTELINNIIVAKAGQIAVFCGVINTGGPPTIKFNNVVSPQGMAYGGTCPDKTGMDGNISADPLFINQSIADYHIQPISPSIDAGDNTAPNLPTTDFDGNPRILDGNGDHVAVVDMGIDEVLPASPPFDICLQDDSSRDILKFNSITGDYQFTNCGSGLVLSGTGSLTKRGSIITLQHYSTDRRVLARIDGSVNKGTASIQLFSLGTTTTITDRNTVINTCACP